MSGERGQREERTRGRKGLIGFSRIGLEVISWVRVGVEIELDDPTTTIG